LFSPQIHRYIFLFGVCGLAFGMMVGTVPTSVPQFILLGNWLLEMDFKSKWLQLKNNKIFWILSSVFLIHIVGLMHTENMSGGWDAIRTKLPIMFLPMVFLSSEQLSRKEFYGVIYCFLAGSVINTAWCYIYTFILHKNEVVRSASRFMSHIRLGLYLNVAIACCAYFVVIREDLIKRIFFGLLIIYFLMAMYSLGLVSGFANFFILSFLSLGYLIFKMNLKIKLLLILSIFTGIFIAGNYILKIYTAQTSVNPTEVNSRLEKAVSGRKYYHFDSTTQKENGNIVHINIQLEELKTEWSRRSPVDSFAFNNEYNRERFQVLIRYLASKGLKKDSVGVWSLSKNDIKNIHNNITNYEMPEWSYFHKRIYEWVNEYDEFKNNRTVNGHSLIMRLYFWKAAIHVIKNNVLFGIGSGDVQKQLNKTYRETNTPLSEEWFKRPHNQFLTIGVALGIFGMIIFILSLVLPIIFLRKYLHVLYWPFILLAIISFLIEDTLETQAGLTFYAFFNAMFISLAYYRKNNAVEDNSGSEI
jgi:O-antigen ligase